MDPVEVLSSRAERVSRTPGSLKPTPVVCAGWNLGGRLLDLSPHYLDQMVKEITSRPRKRWPRWMNEAYDQVYRDRGGADDR